MRDLGVMKEPCTKVFNQIESDRKKMKPKHACIINHDGEEQNISQEAEEAKYSESPQSDITQIEEVSI